MDMYEEKKLSLKDLVGEIRSGQALFTGTFLAYPNGFLSALGEYGDSLEKLIIWSSMGTAPHPVLFKPSNSVISGFQGPVERMVQKKSRNVFFHPIHYSDIVGARDAVRVPDWSVIALTPMDDEGYFSFHAMGAMEYPLFKKDGQDPRTKTVAEVNNCLPRVKGLEEHGGHRIHVSEIDYIVEHHQPVLSPPAEEASEQDIEIAQHVADLIEDNSTIQIGIGSLPNAIASRLTDKKGLGLHTELLSDGLVDLIKSGAITNEHKTLYPGKSIASFAFGSQELLDWIRDSDDFFILPIQAVNKSTAVAKNYKMVSVNSALSIDFRGQVSAHTAGGKIYSGVGGAFEFAYGAQMSEGGKSIICIRSTTELPSGRISNIMPRLPDGSAVTVPEHSVDWVVTEYGAIRLKPLNLDQRMRALISLAHPDYREELMQAAMSDGIYQRPDSPLCHPSNSQ